jgi:hypothetical protein
MLPLDVRVAVASFSERSIDLFIDPRNEGDREKYTVGDTADDKPQCTLGRQYILGQQVWQWQELNRLFSLQNLSGLLLFHTLFSFFPWLLKTS